jgi:hypothetical protein
VDVETVRTRVRIARIQFVITILILWLRKEVSWIGPVHISLDLQRTILCSPPIIY